MDYNKQALKFVKDFELNLSIRLAIPQREPNWIKEGEGYGKCYSFTLSNKDGKHYSSFFWGSIKDKQESKGIKPYDVLACLDTYSDGLTFSEFCAEYGYDVDSIRVNKIFQDVIKQTEGLKKVLSPKAIEALNDIN